MNLKNKLGDCQKYLGNKSGFTVAEGCVVAGIFGAIALTIALYAGLGTLGWNAVKKHVDYEDRYYKVLKMADTSLDGNLDADEANKLYSDLGVVRLPGQDLKDVIPSYKSLSDYLKSNKK